MPPKTRLRLRNYSFQQDKLTKLVEKGVNWDKLYDKVTVMQDKGLLPKGTAARRRAITLAQKGATTRSARYNNKQLRARPRRLTADATPTRLGTLPEQDRAKLYRDAVQICHYEAGKGVSQEYITEQLGDEDNQAFLTRNVDGTVVSYLLIDEEFKDSAYPEMRVAEVNLICAQRGGGLKLLGQAIRHYKEAGYDMIRLEAVPTAVAAYKRAGFKTIKKKGGLTIMVYGLSDRVHLKRPARVKTNRPASRRSPRTTRPQG